MSFSSSPAAFLFSGLCVGLLQWQSEGAAQAPMDAPAVESRRVLIGAHSVIGFISCTPPPPESGILQKYSH